MHFSDVGVIALYLGLGFAIFTVVVSVLGAVRNNTALIASGRRGVLVVAFFLVWLRLRSLPHFLFMTMA